MTQSGSKSNLVYAWVVLFHENINTSEPFQIFPINQFEKKNFPWHAIKGFMHSEVRNEIHSLPSLPGKKYRLFAKIQHGKNCLIYRNGTFSFISVNQFVFLGVDSSRRKMEVDRLNEDYRAMTEMKISMGKIYHYMVESESYRILASAEYSWRESPLRLGRGQAEKEDFTSDDDEEEKKQQRVTAKKCSNLPKKNPSFGKKVRLNILSPFITKIKHRFSNFIQTLKKPMKASTPKKKISRKFVQLSEDESDEQIDDEDEERRQVNETSDEEDQEDDNPSVEPIPSTSAKGKGVSGPVPVTTCSSKTLEIRNSSASTMDSEIGSLRRCIKLLEEDVEKLNKVCFFLLLNTLFETIFF